MGCPRYRLASIGRVELTKRGTFTKVMSKSTRTVRVPEVRNLTDLFRAANWTGDFRQDKFLFDQRIRSIDRGVYVHYLENHHDHPVHDRNGERVGKGTLLMQPGLGAIKFGKFEDGLIRRRSDDARHMHRRCPSLTRSGVRVFDRAPHTFGDCLRLALVLDLTDYAVSIVREAERALRKHMRHFLEYNRLSVENHRGDYRVLNVPAPGALVNTLTRWAERVFDEIVAYAART
jgi:hypothetical protein